MGGLSKNILYIKKVGEGYGESKTREPPYPTARSSSSLFLAQLNIASISDAKLSATMCLLTFMVLVRYPASR